MAERVLPSSYVFLLLLASSAAAGAGCKRSIAGLGVGARDAAPAPTAAPSVAHADAGSNKRAEQRIEAIVTAAPSATAVLMLPREWRILCELEVPRAGEKAEINAWSDMKRIVGPLKNDPDGTMHARVVLDADDQRFDAKADGHAARPALVEEAFDLTLAKGAVTSIRDARGKPVNGERAALVRRLTSDLGSGDPWAAALPERLRAGDALPRGPEALVTWLNQVSPARFTLVTGRAEVDTIEDGTVSFSTTIFVQRAGVPQNFELEGSGTFDSKTGALRELMLSGPATANGHGDRGTGKWTVTLRTTT